MVEVIERPKIRPDFQVCGIDPGGLGGDPFVFEVGARIGGLNWVNIYESTFERIDISGVVREMRYIQDTFKVKAFWWGPDEPRLLETMIGEGFVNAYINGISKKPGSADFRIRTLYSLLSQKRFANDPAKCPMLQEEIGLLRYPRNKRTGSPTRKPRGQDHAIDACTYYLTGEGETPEKPVIDPEDQPLQYMDSNGNWHDNPVAVLAQKAKKLSDPNEWWDEKEASIDEAQYLVEVYTHLGMAIPPELKQYLEENNML